MQTGYCDMQGTPLRVCLPLVPPLTHGGYIPRPLVAARNHERYGTL